MHQIGVHFYFIRIVFCKPEVNDKYYGQILMHVFCLVFAMSPTGYLWHHISNAIIMKIRITFTKEFQYNRNVGNTLFACFIYLSG